MRQLRLSALVAALAVGLAACSASSGREFARYYDPGGFFSTNLPVANDITVTPPQPAQTTDQPGFLAGVVSSPPLPSPSPTSQFGQIGSQFGQQAQATDQTIYEVFVVTTDTFADLPAMVLFFLTQDPGVDVQVERSTRLGGMLARLIIADVSRDGQSTASIAAAFTLGENGTGYILAAVFPSGDWAHQESDFERVRGSFRTDLPPGIDTYPLDGGSA